MKSLLAFDPKKGSFVEVGKYDEETLYMHRKWKTHFCWKHKAYGIQDRATKEILRLGLKKIIVIEEDRKCQWQATVQEWRDNKILDDLGNGPQYFMPIEKMHLMSGDPDSKPTTAKQSDLFSHEARGI